jgi:hypothetical protein
MSVMAYCVTATGRFAIVPKWVRIGDTVAILYRSNVPVVLRASSGDGDGSWRVAGKASVHGAMHGEELDFHGLMESRLR